MAGSKEGLPTKENIPTMPKAMQDIAGKPGSEVLRVVTNESRKEDEKRLLKRAVALASDRLQFYRGQMRSFADECLNYLKQHQGRDANAGQLRRKIHQLDKIKWHDELSTECYKARGEGKLQSLIVSWAVQMRISDKCFVELAHYIGRLGAHVFAVKGVVCAALSLPSIKAIAQVQYDETFSVPERPIGNMQSPGPYELAGSILDARPKLYPSQRLQLLQAFAHVDMQKNLSAPFRSKAGVTPSFKTVVHAELQLCDLASRKSMRFVDNDPYVGCSKPACHFCKRYIMSHHRGFIIPSSHNKVLTGLRAPSADPKLDTKHCSTDGVDLATNAIATPMGQ
ncbi:hypothetical protein PG984_010137 [Apiospora sp. TS-2023a]